jgi:uncharacterized protein DUF397
MNDDLRGLRGWRKSSYSRASQNCAEVAAWRKSSRSYLEGNCAEVGQGAAVVGIRDTKLAASPVLVFRSDRWRDFLARIKAG